MKDRTPFYIANWLRELQDISTAVPVTVQIGSCTFPAARYTVKGQLGVEKTRLYILGELLHSPMDRHLLSDRQSGYDWHLFAWYRQRLGAIEWSEVHLFGTHFILAELSPVENWATDQSGKRPLRRIPMTITELGPSDTGINQPKTENDEPHGS